MRRIIPIEKDGVNLRIIVDVEIEVVDGAIPPLDDSKIIEALSEKDGLTVVQLCERTGADDSTMRRHLDELKANGVVAIANPGGPGRGNARTYRLIS